MANKGKDTIKTVQLRRDTILDKLLNGTPTSEIRRWFNKNYPSLSEHTMEKDITMAYTELKKHVNLNKEDIISEHIVFYDKLAKECKEVGDASNAIKAKQAKEKLLSMHSPDTAIQINNNTLDLSHLSVEELTKLLSATNERTNPTGS